MTVSDAPEVVLADMRRRLGDDPDAAAIREAATEAVGDGDESDRPLDGTDVDALVAAYREQFVTGDAADDVPADHTEAAVDDVGAADHSEEGPSAEGAGTNGDGADGDDADGGGETSRPPASEELPRRIDRVAHFRDSVRTAGEWTVTTGRIGPGLFDVASDARTTEGMDERLDAYFGDVDYEVRSYTLGPDDRHPSWTQIHLAEPVDPSRLPDDLTVRKVEDYP